MLVFCTPTPRFVIESSLVQVLVVILDLSDFSEFYYSLHVEQQKLQIDSFRFFIFSELSMDFSSKLSFNFMGKSEEQLMLVVQKVCYCSKFTIKYFKTESKPL